MASITQVISSIPEAGHRGVDSRTAFVNKQEAFQDALTDVFVGQINSLGNEINLVRNEMNILKNQAETVTATASSSATTSTQKASEANTSANQALTYKNQLQGYVIPAGTSYSVDQINTQNVAMTTAQFNALAEERKANRAGSGFDEWGKHYNQIATFPNINEGMFTLPTQINGFKLGWRDSSSLGTSKTIYPVININGTSLKMQYINNIFSENLIIVPTAPTIYPHDTVLTTEQINSGVIKHADASNSGLIVNGKFDTDTSGWSSNSATLSNVTGKLRVAVASNYGYAYRAITTVIGKQYTIEFDYTHGTNTLASIQVGATSGLGTLILSLGVVDGRFTASFTPTTTTTYVGLLVNGGGLYANFDNIAVYPADAISRSDLVFLELTTSNAA